VRPFSDWGALTAQRLFFALLVLLALIYLTHLGLDMASGTPIGAAWPRALAKSSAYLTTGIQGDLGQTAAGTITGNPAPISEVLPTLLRNSLGLLAVSLLFATVAGVTLGLLASRFQGSNWSTLILSASVVGMSLPSFVAAPLLQIMLVEYTRYFGEPLLPLGGFGWDKRIILPALVLATRPIAQITRVTFVSLNEVTGQDFIRVAYSKGLRPHSVLARHISPNIVIPVLTTVSLSLRYSLSSLPVVEFFFGWPGVGLTLLKSIAQQDYNLTVALIVSLALLMIIVNLLLELLYHRIDPRLRQTGRRSRIQAGTPLLTRIKDFFTAIADILADNPLSHRLGGQNVTPAPTTWNLTPTGIDVAVPDETDKKIRVERRRAVLRGTLGNAPLIIGGFIVLLLAGMVFFGPQLSTHSPFTTQGLVVENGQLSVPPFEPGETYPWGTDMLGRDIQSLILAGARQTLLLGAVVVLVRMLLGVVIGLVAGWTSDSWFDRLALALSETIAAFPTLLLVMILILALGIRQGLQPFVIALCFVGWGEVMQYTRSQVMGVRPKLYIESAVSIGLRSPRIMLGHVLPNLLPGLVSIAALEMSAVLILLGELGFIGIFIGGGSLAEVSGVGVFHYSDIPEWGALLSNIRTYARAYVWTAIYPTGAFFIAILGFNLFGEGVRRLIDNVGVRVARLVNKYTVLIALLALLGFGWARQNTGLLVYYRQQAGTFSGENALASVELLAVPDLEGRALGTVGASEAAKIIATEFEHLDLQPAGQELTYLYERSRSYQKLDAVPRLALDDGLPQPRYRQDYAPFPSLYRNLGQVEGNVRFITTGPLNNNPGFNRAASLALRGKDYSNDILLVLSPADVANLLEVPHAGMLVVAEDETQIPANRTLYTRDPTFGIYGTNRSRGQDSPKLWVTAAMADRMLAGSGYTLDKLRLRADDLLEDQIIELPTSNWASMAMEGTVVDKTATYHVLGHLPGTAGAGERSGLLNSKLIMVIAPYDSPPPDPDGELRPAANNNASGVAVMLETIRTMQQSGYQPYKTFIFVAYSAEGMEGGEVVTLPDPQKLLQARRGFKDTLELEAVIQLHGLGTGTGDELALATGGSRRLANVFEASARWAGVRTTRVDEVVNLAELFDNNPWRGGGQDAPEIQLSWQGSTSTSGTPTDVVEAISADRLEQAGKAVSLALMILGRETEY
jgi:ABC-type dipeptide/oligopeptide/nickel transport system permease component